MTVPLVQAVFGDADAQSSRQYRHAIVYIAVDVANMCVSSITTTLRARTRRSRRRLNIARWMVVTSILRQSHAPVPHTCAWCSPGPIRSAGSCPGTRGGGSWSTISHSSVRTSRVRATLPPILSVHSNPGKGFRQFPFMRLSIQPSDGETWLYGRLVIRIA